MLGIFMGPYVDVGGGLRVGMGLGNDIGTTVVSTLGVFMVPNDGVGYGPG